MKKTNEQLINDMMNSHPLAQVFIIEAILEYSQHCVENRLPDNHIIDADTWQQLAMNLQNDIILRNMEEIYNG